MIVTTTPSVEGRAISDYKGVVVGEAIIETNLLVDMVTSVTDVFGGRSGSYETELQEARGKAMRDMERRANQLGGNAVVGVSLGYEAVGTSMLLVSAAGTAVVLE